MSYKKHKAETGKSPSPGAALPGLTMAGQNETEAETMARTWEQEKAYCARRTEALAEAMENAIQRLDADSFRATYSAAARYMGKKQRQELYRRFLAAANS